MVRYLISSVGLSPEEALKASRILPANLQSPENPDSVLRFLKETGLTPAHIKTLIFWHPRLLCANVRKTLAPRARVLESGGFGGQMLVQLLRSNPYALSLNAVLPRLRFWRAFFGGDERNLLRALKRNRTLINNDINRKITPIISLLRSYGLSDQDIATVMMRVNGFIFRKPDSMKALIEQTEELGFPRGSGMFVQGLSVVAMLKRETLKEKMELFKGFGWSEADLLAAVKKNPNILTLSGQNVRLKMKFLEGQVGCQQSYIKRRPSLLAYSMEKRLLPRHYVLQTLKSKKLIKKDRDLSPVMTMSEKQFVDKFILIYKEQVPNLHQIYTDACAGRIPVS
ncbi:transcription termination factor MTERF2, chloroplastic [Cocos nucifera]|uniref:Transcription termination factor MTERF2, chloroplastic n=1 Tax=Cocos nucifera TaxID=13894 RepID=A0A8K0IWL3_COCNU|nr:transcription termination factor MTERF2, chloroplastic [Cocos nucifera]